MIKTIIIIRYGSDMQSSFNIAVKRAKELISEFPDEIVEVRLSTSGDTTNDGEVLLMNAYTDIDEEDNCTGNDCPHFWYDKKFLDKLDIKYTK